MKISSHWLTDYVDHGLAPAELSRTLTMSGLEVEEENPLGITTHGIVIGRVFAVSPHPRADRLTLCRVDVGRDQPVQIVCGAPNVTAGQSVAVATVGARLQLPGRTKPLKIKRARLRGEESSGMICAEDELGISDDHRGILVLRTSAKPGEPFRDYLERTGMAARDTVLDIAITPNRPDAACHLGVARDIAACRDLPLRRPEVALPASPVPAEHAVSVAIDCPRKCRRYAAMLVLDITVEESPLWLKQRLRAIGLRPSNNVVDVTNFVMHECGQPLHAFDYDAITDHTIIVRESKEGEAITTLDGRRRPLPAGTVLICDAARPVAIGGIMGGENSEVSRRTTRILIESAYFDPSTTRRSARMLGLATDASYRFERGVDADGQIWAAARAAALIAEVARGTVVDGVVDVHPKPMTMPAVALRHSRIEKVLGTEIAKPEARRILTALGFEIVRDGPGRLQCQVPTYRPDVVQEIDLVEEVARIHGFDKIPLPKGTQLPGVAPHPRPEDVLRAEVYGLLGGRGYREIYTNSLLPKDEAERFCDPVLAARGPVVETLNAVSQSMTTLRPTLVPGVLQAMGYNQNRGQEVLRFYEFGHVFHRVQGKVTFIPGFSEYDALILMISGPLGPTEWGEKPRESDFFDLKGDVETLLEVLRVPAVRTEPCYERTTLTRFHVLLRSDGAEIGRMGRMDDAVCAAYDIKAPVFFAEFNWTRLVLHAKDQVARRHSPFSRHPVVTRDISLVVDRAVPAGAIQATIQKAGQPLLQRATVFDLYSDSKLGRNKRTLAFSMRFGAQRTLRDKEVESAVGAIVRALTAEHGAVLRGSVAQVAA